MKSSIDPAQRAKRNRRITGAIVLAVVLGLIIQLWREDRLSKPDRNHAMNELTAKMKPLCIGRYLLDVPALAEVALGNASSDANNIERIPAYVSDSAYAHFLEQREKELRSAKHDTEGSLLKSITKSADGRQTVFVSRPEADDRRTYLVESFVNGREAAWHVSHETGDKYLERVTRQIAEIAENLSYRKITIVPTTPGACLADGLLDRAPLEVEEYHGGARVEALSWSLSVTSETSGPRDNKMFPDLFHRVDRANELIGAGSGIKVLRRAKVQTDGRIGQEYVDLYPEDGAMVFSARLELYGDAAPRQPTIKLLMEAGWPIKKDPRDLRQFMNQEEALAVWDAIVKSIRPRPGAF